MNILKAFINSLLCGFYFSLLFSILIFDLNTDLSFSPSIAGRIVLFAVSTYGLIIAALSLLLFALVRFISAQRVRVRSVSPSFFILGTTFITILFLFIFRANQTFYSALLPPVHLLAMGRQFTLFALLAASGFLLYYLYARRGKNLWIFAVYPLLLCLFLSMAAVMRKSSAEMFEQVKVANLEAKSLNKRITVIGLEGLSLDFLIPFINEDKLPNFQVLLEQGCWGRLENTPPNEALILNATFNTGKLPYKHGRISPFLFMLRPFSLQIQVVPRYIFFRQLARTGQVRISPHAAPLQSKDIWQIFEANRTSQLRLDWPYNSRVEQPPQRTEMIFNQFYDDLKSDTSPKFQIVKTSLYSDIENEEVFAAEKDSRQPQLSYLLLSGLNDVESYFYKYSYPDLYGSIDQEEINKYSTVIERYYRYYDQIVGRYLASLKMDEMLLIYSPHGIEPLPLWKRFVEWILGNPELSAYHDQGPEGVILFYGNEIVRGKNIEAMRLIDIAPTLLNYLGLPVGRDMDGIVNSSIFLDTFKFENPVLYISSYEEIDIK